MSEARPEGGTVSPIRPEAVVPGGSFPLRPRRGRSLRVGLIVRAGGQPADLTGWIARMQVRATSSSPGVLLDLSSEDGTGRLTIEVARAADGTVLDSRVVLFLAREVTRALPFDYGVYDVEISNPGEGGDDVPLLAGPFDVESEVTR